MPYEDLSTGAQVRRLRVTARQVLALYPLTVGGLRLVHHGYNTTFRVDTTDGRRFALRINVNSRRSEANVYAEVSWVDALARDTDLDVPVPQATRDGRLFVHVFSPDLQRTVPAVLYSWLPGALLGRRPPLARMRAVGRAMATMHEHASGWTLPEGAELTTYDNALLRAPNNLPVAHDLLPPERREVIDAAMRQVDETLAALHRTGRPHVMHGDLHNGNLKWSHGRLMIFDFDDSGIGLPLQDLATSAYYSRDDVALEEAVQAGYETVRPLPPFTAPQFEAIVAGRGLALLNELFVITTASIRAMVPRFTADTVARLRAYLDTGVFRFDVPGAEPRARRSVGEPPVSPTATFLGDAGTPHAR